MLIHMISLTVLKIFAKYFFNGDLGLTLTLSGKVKFAFFTFILSEFMELVEDFSANVNKYS